MAVAWDVKPAVDRGRERTCCRQHRRTTLRQPRTTWSLQHLLGLNGAALRQSGRNNHINDERTKEAPEVACRTGLNPASVSARGASPHHDKTLELRSAMSPPPQRTQGRPEHRCHRCTDDYGSQEEGSLRAFPQSRMLAAKPAGPSYRRPFLRSMQNPALGRRIT